jgi:glyoxylate carboligase
MSEKMNTGDHIVRNLIANGVDTVFGLPGVQTYPIFDALARNADKIRTVSARHEQATAYMALGYAKSTGRPSAYSVVPGPGVLNTGAAQRCAQHTVSMHQLCVLRDRCPRNSSVVSAVTSMSLPINRPCSRLSSRPRTA